MDNFIDKLADRYNAGDMIRANAQADAQQMDDLREQVEAYEAVLQEMRKLNYKNTELTEKMYSLVDESIEKVRSLSATASAGGADTELIALEMNEAVTKTVSEAFNSMDEAVARSVQEALGGMDEKVSKAVSESLAAGLPENDNINQGITDLKLLDEGTKAALSNIQESVNLTNAGIASQAQNQAQSNEETKSYLENILSSIETTRAAVTDLRENPPVSQVPAAVTATESEELRQTMAELSASTEEIRTGVRNVKASNDDTKTSLKSALDSAIYGLKQDNREIVEFMQRMNTNIVNRQNDPEAEKKEEEARVKAEEDKKALEERFKMTEDFMHKESVKVYRNVQAVINEKGDRNAGNLEARIKSNTSQIGQVKVIAIIAMLLSAAGVALQVLQILGIL